MKETLQRTAMLFGQTAMTTLQGSKVAVFGVGGVGGYVVEVLARSGVGEIAIIDNDLVATSNINRQIIALTSTIGQYKVDVMERRIHDINPECTVHTYKMFYLPENADEIDLSAFDYVVDCIDTVKAKMELIRRCHTLRKPIISSMGAANKLDPTGFRVTDLAKTKIDPLAKVLRKKLRKEGITHLKVVCSDEEPLEPMAEECGNGAATNEPSADEVQPLNTKKFPPASNAFVPATAGLIMGGEVVKDLINAAGTMRMAQR